MVLRDSYGVAQVRNVTGNKILRILRSKGTYVCTPVGIEVVSSSLFEKPKLVVIFNVV